MRVSYISLLDLPSRMAHAMQIMKNAQAWAKACPDFEFITCLTPSHARALPGLDLAQLYGLGHKIPLCAYALNLKLGPWLGGRLGPYDPLFSQRLYLRQAARRCARRGVELVYTRTYAAPRYTLPLGLPTLVETHSPPGDPTPEKLDLYRRVKEDPNLLGLVTISDQLRDMFLEAGLPKEKLLVLPDGADLDAFSPALSQAQARQRLGMAGSRPLAVYVGHLYDGRGVGHILDAAQALPQADFLLVGGHDQDVDRWRARARDQGLTNLALTGFVPNQMVPTYLWAGDILLMPYENSCPTSGHMSPLKMFEYLAAGRAIVATDLPALRAVLRHGENAWLCGPDQAPPLIQAMGSLLDSPDLRRKLASGALASAREYSWDRRVERVLEFAGQARLPGGTGMA